MPASRHPAIKTPPAETVLWRYLDFTKFVSMLDSSSLFFTRCDLFDDPFEGSYPNRFIHSRVRQRPKAFPTVIGFTRSTS